ncbi:MAG: carbon monoxide dehydrogenase subunit G [Pseudomonadota bacterium]
MEIKGSSVIAADRQKVWDGLNDPEILRQSIPGCESLEPAGENKFTATVVTAIGPIKAKFNYQIELRDLNPPNSYVITGSGSAGAMGMAKGNVNVTLSDDPGGTRLDYQVDADISGKIAQLGSRLIESTAGVLSGQFFSRFSQLLDPDAAADGGQGVPVWVYAGIGAAVVVAAILFVLLGR